MDLQIRKANEADLEKINLLSQNWEDENITYGMVASEIEDLRKIEIWLCEIDREIVGYISGDICDSSNLAVLPRNEKYFEVDELYVASKYRSKGIGAKLYRYVENEMKKKDVRYVMLQTATKNQEKALIFYKNLGFDIWTTTLFKEITNEDNGNE